MFFLDFQTKNWTKYLVTLTVCKLWGGLCIIFTGQLASKADEFRLNRQKSPKARAHSGERAPKLKVKLTTQFRQPHLSALIAHSWLEFSLNHLVLLSNTYLVTVRTSVSNVVELPGAGLGRMITINSEFNGTTLELVTLTLYYMQSPLIRLTAKWPALEVLKDYSLFLFSSVQR